MVHGGHGPSWARTRTLLIQRGRHNQLNSSNLQGLREFVSPAAGVCRLECWNRPTFAHSNVRVCGGSGRQAPQWPHQRCHATGLGAARGSGGLLFLGPMRLMRYLLGLSPCPSVTTANEKRQQELDRERRREEKLQRKLESCSRRLWPNPEVNNGSVKVVQARNTMACG
jgi:hypothetical protein